MALDLNKGVFYEQFDDGLVWFGKNGIMFVRGGPTADQMLYLAPLLNGRSGFDELTQNLTEVQRATVCRLVDELIKQDLVVDTAATTNTSKPAVRARPKIFVIASEPMGSWCLDALDALKVELYALSTAPEPDAMVEADATVHLFGHKEIGSADTIRQSASNSQTVLVQALVSNQAAVISATGPWRNIWSELRSKDKATLSSSQLAMEELPARILLTYLVSLSVEGVEPTQEQGDCLHGNNIVWFDAATLHRSDHQLSNESWAGGFQVSLATRQTKLTRLRSTPPILTETFSRSVTRALDERFGPITNLGEDGLTQVPIRCSRASVVNSEDGFADVIGYGFDFENARLMAAKRALGSYCLGVADLRSSSPQPRIGFQLETYDPIEVQLSEGSRLGVGVGLSWTEMLKEALIAVTRAEVTCKPQNGWVMDTGRDASLFDAESQRLYGALKSFHPSLRLVCLSDVGVLPVVAVGFDDTIVSVGVGLGTAAAATDGMMRALVQAQGVGIPESALVIDRYTAPEIEHCEIGVDNVVAGLIASNRTPVLLPILHEFVAEITPFISAMVILDD